MSLILSLPLLAIFLWFISTETFMIKFDILDVSFSSTVAMNSLLIIFYITSFSVFCYLRSDLHMIALALFPQILVDKERDQEEYDEI